MKKITVSLIMLAFLALSFTKERSSVIIKILKVKAPFNMPDIKVSDFSKCGKLPITEFGAVKGDKEKTAQAKLKMCL